MSDNGNNDSNKPKGNKKNQKSYYKKSYGIPSHCIGKEKELGNNDMMMKKTSLMLIRLQCSFY